MKSFFINELKYVGYIFLIVLVVTLVIMIAAYLFSFSSPDSEKISMYECGFNPYEDARNVFDVHFYIVCILFVVFDLETVFFLPWCMSFNTSTLESFWVMIDFIFELIVGYFYVYNAGGLNWKFLK